MRIKICTKIFKKLQDDISLELGNESVDLVSMIFVLSAIHPDKMKGVFQNLSTCMKPGSLLLFRDYAINDMAMIRFKPGSKLASQFYVRQDGTR